MTDLVAELRDWLAAHWDPDLTVGRVVGPTRDVRVGRAALAGRLLRPRSEPQ